jgi:small subunit ribosomal protein S13
VVYILNINLKNTKRVYVALCKIFGVGKYQAINLCNRLNIGVDKCLGELNQMNLFLLLKQIEQQNLVVENELQQQRQNSISELIDMKSYKGVRHIFRLPVRGQRTRTNARTRKRFK